MIPDPAAVAAAAMPALPQPLCAAQQPTWHGCCAAGHWAHPEHRLGHVHNAQALLHRHLLLLEVLAQLPCKLLQANTHIQHSAAQHSQQGQCAGDYCISKGSMFSANFSCKQHRSMPHIGTLPTGSAAAAEFDITRCTTVLHWRAQLYFTLLQQGTHMHASRQCWCA